MRCVLYLLGGFLHVDIVDADTGASNDAHLARSLNDRRGHLKNNNNKIIENLKIKSAFTFVALLTTRASYSPIIFTSSASGIVFLKSTTCPLDLKMLIQH